MGLSPQTRKLMEAAAARACDYLETLAERRVAPAPEAIGHLSRLGGPLPLGPSDPMAVLDLLHEVGSPATVASAGGRYFGFVIGGSLPAPLVTNWLAGAWDQDAVFVTLSPVSATLESIALGWLLDLLGLPREAGGGFVTGATMANFTCLAAARHAALERAGWDAESRGLFGAPEIRVVAGDEVHVSLLKALGLLGLGRDRITKVPVDGQGRMRAEALLKLDGMTILCIQAGNVNTGAFDPARELCRHARAAGAWVHVDGAFGLWAGASSSRAHLVDGVENADSWALDCHKWLNVPYDSGVAFCRNPEHLRAAMSATAAYLQTGDQREPGNYTPEMSRRARGVEIWAAIRSLGRDGIADLIERSCRHATRFAEGLRAAGYEVLNEVDLNQVLVSFGEAETTKRVIAGIQAEGTCWCGGTVWQGHTAMRISVSSWATTDEDVERSLEAILRVASGVRSQERQ